MKLMISNFLNLFSLIITSNRPSLISAGFPVSTDRLVDSPTAYWIPSWPCCQKYPGSNTHGNSWFLDHFLVLIKSFDSNPRFQFLRCTIILLTTDADRNKFVYVN